MPTEIWRLQLKEEKEKEKEEAEATLINLEALTWQVGKNVRTCLPSPWAKGRVRESASWPWQQRQLLQPGL